MTHADSTTQAPWVSFCMSTYKRPDMLREQIQVILQQSFRDFEIVISDNDPDSVLTTMINEFNDSRIRYAVNEVNLGMVKSFNRSLQRSRGSFVVMITDDDPVYPNMLQELYDLHMKYPGYGAYFGGCNIKCYTVAAAAVMRSKVGLNSCLSSEMDYGTVKIFESSDFPILFLDGKLGSLLLWSCGVIRKDILVKNGGMPDYGSEYFTDHAYNLVNCSEQGMVYLNKSLGHQSIHGQNFGFTQMQHFDKYQSTPEKFVEWVSDKLNTREDWKVVEPHLFQFTGRAVVEFSLFIKRTLIINQKSTKVFHKSLDQIFKIPYLKKWKRKYILLSRYPFLFQMLLQLKSRLSK